MFSCFQPCFDGRNQLFLCHVLLFQSCHHILIHRVLGDNVVDGDHLCLALPPEASIGLLVEFKAPCQAEPDQNVSTLLDVQTMSGRGRVD